MADTDLNINESTTDKEYLDWADQYMREHNTNEVPARDQTIWANMDTITKNWQQAHGFTPINWQSFTDMGAGPSNNWTRFDYPFPQRGVQPAGLYGGYGGGGGGGLTPEQKGSYQQNFINSVRTGNWYNPSSMSGFGPSEWYAREGYDFVKPETIPQGSWLWGNNMPAQYRDIYQATTPEIQSLMSNALIPEYQRREDYSVTPGQTRWMR